MFFPFIDSNRKSIDQKALRFEWVPLFFLNVQIAKMKNLRYLNIYTGHIPCHKHRHWAQVWKPECHASAA